MAEAVSSGQEVVNIGVKELLDAGIHFGHQSRRWNPKMKRFIFGKRNGICIIDLTKTLAQLKHAQQFVYETAAQGRDVLFVGTKKQAQEAVKEAATRCGQHYVNNRWLGGTLTNNRHIRVSIKRMQEIEEMEEKGAMENMPMKEVSRLRHELERHHRFLSGLAKMDSMPGAMVVIDVNRESIAVKEANRMGIPVVAIVDTNCDPDPIAYPIPGNDDSSRAVRLVLNVIAEAIIQASAEYTANAAKRQAAKEEAAKERTVSGKAHDASDDDDQEETARPRSRRREGERSDARRPRRSASSGKSEARTSSDGAKKPAGKSAAKSHAKSSSAKPAAEKTSGKAAEAAQPAKPVE
ncbi:MAG: 30S ribosomal protein S2 [Kiritimatiellia bacterium]